MEGKLRQQVPSRFPERSVKVISGRQEKANVSPSVRAGIRSAGLHLGALKVLARDDYTNDEYIRAAAVAEELGLDSAYEAAVLGAAEEEPHDVGEDLHLQATRALLARGIANPTYDEYRDALVEVSS
jgi:hypothetical protein